MITNADLAPAVSTGSPPTLSDGGKPPRIAAAGAPYAVYGKPTYWAVLKKRFGTITASDFRRYGHEFFALCHDEYGAHKLECYRDWNYGIDTVDSARERLLAAEQMYRVPFETVFQEATSIYSMMTPRNPPDAYRHSLAWLFWDKERPGALWFYAQSGGLTHETNGPLCSILEHQLFPRKFSLRWIVRRGPREWSREWHGT